MISAPAIANAGPRDWRSNGGFRDLAGGCVRAKAVKRHATRRAKAEEEREAPAAVGSPTRVCADCGTSETPLWRSGPAGPKSLCNACGIKYRKRKKALEPASRSSDAGSDGQAREEPSPEELKKRQRLKQERMLKLLLLQHEKQRGGREEEKKATVEEHGKEEVEEAALLLMSLSSGLVLHSYLRLHFQAPDLSLSGSSDPGTNPEESSPEPDDAAAGGEGPQRRVPFHRSLENGHDQGVYKGILVGKVGQNPVQKYLRSGRPVVLFSLGTGGIRNNQRPLDNVEPRDYADRCSVRWHRACVYPDRLGNLALKHVKLGSILYVEGNLETKVFTDQVTGLVSRLREIAIRRDSATLSFFSCFGFKQRNYCPFVAYKSSSLSESW